MHSHTLHPLTITLSISPVSCVEGDSLRLLRKSEPAVENQVEHQQVGQGKWQGQARWGERDGGGGGKGQVGGGGSQRNVVSKRPW